MRFAGSNVSFTPYKTGWQQYFFSVFTSYVSFRTVACCYQQSLPRCITCHRCLRWTVTCSKTPSAVTLNLCCHVIENYPPQVSQPASAGNVADLVKCKLISHHRMMQEQWIRLLCSVSVIPANETVIARGKSIKLLTLGFREILVLRPNFQLVANAHFSLPMNTRDDKRGNSAPAIATFTCYQI